MLKRFGHNGNVTFFSSRKESTSKLQFIYFRGGKDFWGRSLITVSKIKRIQHVEEGFRQWEFFSLCAVWQDEVSPFSNNEYLLLEQNVQGLLQPTWPICHLEDFIKCLWPVFIKCLQFALQPNTSSWAECNYTVLSFFFSLRTVLYISALSAVEHPEGNKLKTLCAVSQTHPVVQRQTRDGCQLPHTQLCLSLPGHGAVSGLDGTQIR